MLLPRSEQESLREEDNNKDEIAILGDRDCERPKAISRLKPKYCQEVFKLPIRASNPELPLWFSSVLRNVYARDYDMPNIMQFGTSDNQIVQEGFVFRQYVRTPICLCYGQLHPIAKRTNRTNRPDLRPRAQS